jgi:hypothetical protein
VLDAAGARNSVVPEQLLLASGDTWLRVRDGNHTALSIFDRHYTSRRKHLRKIAQFVGPGQKCVLLTPCARALFVWRKFLDDMDDGSGKRQEGRCCAVFRNEGAGLSSDLIRAADAYAWREWPGERHYTTADPDEIRSTNPGFCFMQAGWRKSGKSKRGLQILEVYPHWVSVTLPDNAITQ